MDAPPAPSLPRVWLLATRPATLTAALSPVMVGAAAAWRASGGGAYRWGAVAAALLGAMFIQIGTNLANDVFDFEKGADTAERLGPTRVTQAGLLSPSQVRAGMVASFALATLAGVYLTAVAGWAIVAIGVASIASGVAYTGGPYPLGYNGLGDVFVFVFFGLVAVGGTAFVALGTVPPLALALAAPVGALATAVLVVNNVRDHRTDVRAGKRTLVVRFGRRFGVAEYVACWAVALAVPLALALSRRAPWMLLPLLTLPLGVALARKVATLEGRPLNPVLGATAGALLLHSVLTTLGLLLPG
ncbi:MAG: 1,4-dihydroxy-2-naphthoate polyprenyltransferase [Deltaproteobacteria bacterium]|nr:1,4-dihydroxy-2-naphthoate polyprenyltransferase [Myxococcales bacterium]MDP3217180.1 1,4-dihydroxy-2-naphthoate polyprenyltransferase [Deltaproteobacteria bacterium]